MVEGARLESVYTGNRIEGSNPSLSARLFRKVVKPFIVIDYEGLSLWCQVS